MNNLSFKCERFTPSGCEDKRIRKFDFVTKPGKLEMLVSILLSTFHINKLILLSTSHINKLILLSTFHINKLILTLLYKYMLVIIKHKL